ncbi:phosphomannose isomerase type II C-terminal cupin domain [Candidatus Uhrbacteria bacterium]|nr:phosphomannose isomerase type II C-terminal cupin domain [Candidatus Uhrbacteria bacterium]
MTTSTTNKETCPANFKTISRPWCDQIIYDTAGNFQVKRITVKAGMRSSYQTHARRNEYWVVVTGLCRFVLDGIEHVCGPGETANAHAGVKHRFGSANAEPMTLIEIQSGDYFGEDDIVRYEDDFGRV